MNERFKRLKKIEDEEGDQYYYFDFGLNILLSKLLIFCSSDPNKKAQVDFDFIADSSHFRGDVYPLQVRALQKIINKQIEPYINWDHKIKFLQIIKNI